MRFLEPQASAMESSALQMRLQLIEQALKEVMASPVRFKTTRRAHYDAFTPGVFDTVLCFSSQPGCGRRPKNGVLHQNGLNRACQSPPH